MLSEAVKCYRVFCVPWLNDNFFFIIKNIHLPWLQISATTSSFPAKKYILTNIGLSFKNCTHINGTNSLKILFTDHLAWQSTLSCQKQPPSLGNTAVVNGHTWSCIPIPSLSQVSDEHAHGIHDVKEIVISQTSPPSFITTWSSSDAHMIIVGTLTTYAALYTACFKTLSFANFLS